MYFGIIAALFLIVYMANPGSIHVPVFGIVDVSIFMLYMAIASALLGVISAIQN